MYQKTPRQPSLAEQIAAIEDQIANLERQRQALIERQQREGYMHHAESDPGFLNWRAKRRKS